MGLNGVLKYPIYYFGKKHIFTFFSEGMKVTEREQTDWDRLRNMVNSQVRVYSVVHSINDHGKTKDINSRYVKERGNCLMTGLNNL